MISFALRERVLVFVSPEAMWLESRFGSSGEERSFYPYRISNLGRPSCSNRLRFSADIIAIYMSRYSYGLDGWSSIRGKGEIFASP
jgi:hypothetical protein